MGEEPAEADGMGHPFLPIPVVEIELSEQREEVERNAAGEVWALVRLHRRPLGVLALTGTGAAGIDLRTRALTAFAPAIGRHLEGDGVTVADPMSAITTTDADGCPVRPAAPAGLVSVVVCTLGRDPRLIETVQSVLNQSHRDLELLVVDNQPESGRVDALLSEVSDPRLRIVRQPRRGLSAARNAGLAGARGVFVAYTDDDAFADADWLVSLLAPFAEDPRVACTTGLVLPAALDTPAQVLFEEFGGFDKGFDRVVWAATDVSDVDRLGKRGQGGILFPYAAGVFGSGNNMAFRTAWAREHGLFDEALGAGALTRGGEDLDAFLAVMLAKAVLVYEPAAVVKHYARSSFDDLRQQMFGYGSGMSAVLVKHFLASPRAAAGILVRLPAGLRRLLSSESDKNTHRTAEFPPELSRAELRGYVAGPLLYARARRRSRTRLRADR